MSNETVYQRAQTKQFSSILLQHQLVFFGKIAAGPHDALRALLLEKDSVTQVGPPGPRCRGRPRDTWISKMLVHASLAAGGETALATTLLKNYTDRSWKRQIHDYTTRL